MIGRLRGTILERQPPDLLLDVNGVGYEVQAPMSTFYRLPEANEAISLYTHLVVREDAQLLYGFIDDLERQLFRTLIKVNGVGPKLALTILSGIEVKEFVACVNNGDTASLIRLPGVGRKTAERLLVEMSDRLKDWMPALEQGALSSSTPTEEPVTLVRRDAESALVALGYKPAEAAKAIKAVVDESITSSEVLIRLALRAMVN